MEDIALPSFLAPLLSCATVQHLLLYAWSTQVLPQIYISHIYTEPRFTQTQIYTNPDLHQTQIYTALHWHTQIYTTQIYTKLNPNLHRPKFTQAQIYIHIFGQISNNPNLHNPNLHKTQIYTAQIYVTQIYTQLKIVLEPHATIVPKCMFKNVNVNLGLCKFGSV